MVECSQFLEGYSSYRDGELDDETRLRFEAHLSGCASCARYDRVITKGVHLYTQLPEITPSDDFLPRLQHRLFHVEEEMRGPGRTGSGAQAALTLAIAATIAAVAWVPATRTSPSMLELPPVAARAPAPAYGPTMFQDFPVYEPARVGLDSWNPARPESPASDLLFRYPADDQGFQVRSVMQR